MEITYDSQEYWHTQLIQHRVTEGEEPDLLCEDNAALQFIWQPDGKPDDVEDENYGPKDKALYDQLQLLPLLLIPAATNLLLVYLKWKDVKVPIAVQDAPPCPPKKSARLTGSWFIMLWGNELEYRHLWRLWLHDLYILLKYLGFICFSQRCFMMTW